MPYWGQTVWGGREWQEQKLRDQRGYGSNSGEREWCGLDKGGNNGKGGASLKETD